MNKIITIGRMLGSGGRELGKRLAELLGWAYYDSEIIRAIAKKTDLAESYVKQIIEHSPVVSYPITIGQSFFHSVYSGMDQTTNIYVEQSNIIKEMASKSNCVIVGRCADYILSKYNPFRIFVYASTEARIERCKQKAENEEEATEARLWRNIRRVDRHRSKYYMFYTGRKWGDKNNYDICINTTNASIESIAKALVKMLQPEEEIPQEEMPQEEISKEDIML